MMKQFCALYLLCVRMAQRTDGVMKNKPVFPSKFWKFHIVLC